MEPQPIDVAAIQQRVLRELREAELEVARLKGKLEMLGELIAPPKFTEGEDAPPTETA